MTEDESKLIWAHSAIVPASKSSSNDASIRLGESRGWWRGGWGLPLKDEGK
jgi:hypothetical protein